MSMQFFRLIISVLLFTLISSTASFAQLPAFSGFWLTPQLTAPTAMAGNNAYLVSAHYRRQGFDGGTGYRTFMLSSQIPLYSRANTQFGTLGVNIMRDESGSSYLFSTSGVLLTYLYDVTIAQRHHLVAGVQGAYYWRKIDWSEVTTNNQFVNGSFDPALSSGEEFSDDPSKAFLANVGLAYYLTDYEGDQLFHIGAALTNANSGSFNYLMNPESQSVPRRLVGYAHVRLMSNSYFDVVSDLYLRNENKVNDVVGGFRLRKGLNPRARIANNHLGLGLYYSQDHTGILALQLIQQHWLVGISYDMAFGSKPIRNMQNAVEITLGWRAVRESNPRSYNPRKNRRKLPWNNKRKLPWQNR